MSPRKSSNAGHRPLALPLSRARTLGFCQSGKLRWPDEVEAAKALEDAVARHKGTGRVECRWYACPTCHGFHLTSQPLNER